MTPKSFRRPGVVAALVVAAVLAGAAGSLAWQTTEEPGMAHPPMAPPPAMGEGMMGMHKEMQARMTAMDLELAELVAAMEAASGDRKVDAVAAVVNALVSQRQAMREAMIEMQPRMMHRMMEHMSSGMKQPMAGCGCPMMQQAPPSEEPSGEEDHSAHHPQG